MKSQDRPERKIGTLDNRTYNWQEQTKPSFQPRQWCRWLSPGQFRNFRDITENSLLKVNTAYASKGYQSYAWVMALESTLLTWLRHHNRWWRYITSTHIVKRRWLTMILWFSTSYTHSGIKHLDLIAEDIIDSGRHFGTLPDAICGQQVLITCIMMEAAWNWSPWICEDQLQSHRSPPPHGDLLRQNYEDQERRWPIKLRLWANQLL